MMKGFEYGFDKMFSKQMRRLSNEFFNMEKEFGKDVWGVSNKKMKKKFKQ